MELYRMILTEVRKIFDDINNFFSKAITMSNGSPLNSTSYLQKNKIKLSLRSQKG